MQNKRTAISTSHLTKVFGNFTAVSDISIDIYKGEIFGLLGENGAGKSTTIRMLCGIIPPTDGSGSIIGYDIMKHSRTIRNYIGYMSQKFSLYEELTVRENLNFIAKLFNVRKSTLEHSFKEIISMLNLKKYLDIKTKHLPLGIKQSTSMAAAIIHNPRILLLDEPTSGVDPISRRNFWDVIYTLSTERKVTTLVTTHYMEEAEYCDRIAFISAGRMQAIGTPNELKTNNSDFKAWRLATDDLYKAYTILNDDQNIFDVNLLSDSIHLLVKKGSDYILETMKKNNISGVKLEAETLSLEDIFVSLTKKKRG